MKSLTCSSSWARAVISAISASERSRRRSWQSRASRPSESMEMEAWSQSRLLEEKRSPEGLGMTRW